MVSRGMKKFRKVEKIGLVGLCVLMLGTLGIGTGTVFRGCGEPRTAGSFVLSGERIDVDRGDYRDYRSWLSFQRIMRRFHYNPLGGPPLWKFGIGIFGRPDKGMEDYQADERDLWTFIVLDHLAEETGVEVPPEAVQHWIRSTFSDRKTGRFNRGFYDRWLSDKVGLWPTAKDFEKLVAKCIGVRYLVQRYATLLNPTREEVYDTWKRRNERHTARYIVQPVAPLRAKLDPASFSPEEVRDFYGRDRVRRIFRIPTRRRFEAVYLLPGDLTGERYESLVAKAEKLGIAEVTEEEAFQYYYGNQENFPLEPVRERLKAEWEKEKAAKEKAAKEKAEKTEAGRKGEAPPKEGPSEEKPSGGKPAEEKPSGTESPKEKPGGEDHSPGIGGPEDVFKDPTVEMTPRERFDAYFKDRVERDLFARHLLARLLSDERIHKKGLEAIVGEYGLPYLITEHPLDQYEIQELPGVGCAKLRDALNLFPAGKEGEYAEDLVRCGKGEERGWLFFRVLDVVPEHYPELGSTLEKRLLAGAVRSRIKGKSEKDLLAMEPRSLLALAFPDAKIPVKKEYTVEEVVRLLYRQSRAEDQAVAALEAVREAVLGGAQTLGAAAAERGYAVRDLRAVTKETRVPDDLVPPEGGELSEKQREENRLRACRRFLVKGRVPGRDTNLDRIKGTPPEHFLPEVLTDKETDSAYLVYVVKHEVPGEEEMPEAGTSDIWLTLRERTKRQSLRTFFSFDRIAERYHLDVRGLTDKDEEKTPGE